MKEIMPYWGYLALATYTLASAALTLIFLGDNLDKAKLIKKQRRDINHYLLQAKVLSGEVEAMRAEKNKWRNHSWSLAGGIIEDMMREVEEN